MAPAAASKRQLTGLLYPFRRTFTTSRVRYAEQDPRIRAVASLAASPETPAAPVIDAPRASGKRVAEFTPKPLPRPIGLPYPPQAGENTGIDRRTLRQRRDDFVNWDKHLERRRELKEKISRPYFRDWSNLKFHQGKSFLAPPRLFKADKSLYFPNFYGRTLLKTEPKRRDTTPVLEGKASVVAIYSSAWAENQVETFVSKEANPALDRVFQNSKGLAQLVRINVEDNWFKAWLIRLFVGSLRRRIGEANWGNYFVVRKAISDEIRESVGLLNSKVGYTYLVDSECRIRWAGSGASNPDERESLAKGTQKLVEDLKQSRKTTPPATQAGDKPSR